MVHKVVCALSRIFWARASLDLLFAHSLQLFEKISTKF